MDLPDAGDPAPLLPYESAAKEAHSPRPWWVYVLVAIYLLILAAMFLLPALAASNMSADDRPLVGLITAYACGLAICGLSLLVLPVRAVRRRPTSRRSIWFPIIGSGLAAALLVFGAGLAICELFRGENAFLLAILSISLAVWIGWAIIFSLIAFRAGPERIGGKLHQLLIAGSVLELLIAVPSNVIVRRRSECCAGMETGVGICVGVSVMLIALGPSVLILYHKRRKQILPPSPLRRN